MKTILLSSLLLMGSLRASAQEPRFPSGKEKYDGKPAGFANVPKDKSFGIENAALHRLMALELRAIATVPCAEQFNFKGVVTEKRSDSPQQFTLTIRALDDEQLICSVSRLSIDGKTIFRGIILRPNESDMLILEPDESGHHVWKKVQRSSLLAD